LILNLANTLTQLMEKRLTCHVPQHSISMCLTLAHRRVSPLVLLTGIVALTLTMVAQLVTMDLSGVTAPNLTGVTINPLFVLARAAITETLMIDVRP
jgi:hypothetical protein